MVIGMGVRWCPARGGCGGDGWIGLDMYGEGGGRIGLVMG